ncbi:hypothetical protein bthur0001_16630 [Bacillus thuringiensis serovar tochigiensis BGSC 4Y1]|nr:hypothetical protein bthur0001_16630 [Bacillus thuringiensis serovar tochigiensis BGSC 4Y1]
MYYNCCVIFNNNGSCYFILDSSHLNTDMPLFLFLETEA